MLTLAYASRPPGVKREPSAILGLTRSGKERQDERILQTLLLKVGSLHLKNVTKPEDLPD